MQCIQIILTKVKCFYSYYYTTKCKCVSLADSSISPICNFAKHLHSYYGKKFKSNKAASSGVNKNL
jgi:hypothetical protein